MGEKDLEQGIGIEGGGYRHYITGSLLVPEIPKATPARNFIARGEPIIGPVGSRHDDVSSTFEQVDSTIHSARAI